MNIRVMPLAALLAIAASLVACDKDKAGQLQLQKAEAPPLQQVSYADDVAPILQKHCAECHVAGKPGAEATGLHVDSYASLMKDTRYGPVIHPGSARTSSLYILVSSKDNLTISMPHGKAPLSAEDIETIRVWIDNGAVEN
ncbi:MAG TPA: c-type cytochrome domain-containing protein [Gammaproteobacteria bacterium]|nr:c-type cytochrome domain-containing protein [Gammaproteobacteria bacterium]